eukprot:CAMPEP_0181295120 /NCGR_PEP_ID=MMETSP1101-20121128/3970_1 /TAXON_ID=46948 /ORGANISM="Rhodomonas abbreviata, Strain Caron Lab Isolate" /LENGTH=414 /DNA_ID=CAMNT_0023399835 /DNA_START=18 /DNA_END=1262 /DNA_ORIENTATION=+
MAKRPFGRQKIGYHFKSGERYKLTSIALILVQTMLFREAFQILRRLPPLGFGDAQQALLHSCASFTLATARLWKMRQRRSNKPYALINDFDPDEFIRKFRFRPEHVRLMLSLFGWLDANGNSKVERLEEQSGVQCVPNETILLIVLRCLARPLSFEDIIDEMGGSRTGIARAFDFGTFFIYEKFAKPLNNFYAWRNWFDEFTEVIWQKGCLFRNCVSFVDGVFFRICRPGGAKNVHAQINQRVFYNGYEKCHGIKYIGSVFPNGILLLWGPFYGSEHDSPCLAKTPILAALRRLFYRMGRWYLVFGDSAFAMTRFVQRMIKGPAAHTAQGQAFNGAMAPLRVDIEHAFRDVQRDWSGVKWVPGQCLGLRPVGRYTHVCIFLHNCMGLLCGNLQTAKFGQELMGRLTLAEYLAHV